tara:strand:- start:226 stop:738 length:513 start_codon:yes stop_codon:yes gene_type:complete
MPPHKREAEVEAELNETQVKLKKANLEVEDMKERLKAATQNNTCPITATESGDQPTEDEVNESFKWYKGEIDRVIKETGLHVCAFIGETAKEYVEEALRNSSIGSDTPETVAAAYVWFALTLIHGTPDAPDEINNLDLSVDFYWFAKKLGQVPSPLRKYVKMLQDRVAED